MGVADLREGEGQGGAAVPDPPASADPLGQVEVPQGHVGRLLGEGLRRDRVQVAPLDRPLRLRREPPPRGVEVPRQEDRLAGGAPLPQGGEDRPVGLPADPTQGGLRLALRGGTEALAQAGEVPRAEEGNRPHPGGDPSLPIPQGQTEPVRIEALPVLPPGPAPHHPGLRQGEELPGRLQPHRRVVVPPDQEDLDPGAPAAELRQEVAEEPHRLGGGVRPVEDVPRHDQRVRLLLGGPFGQPAQEGLVLLGSVDVVKGRPEVPVRGVDQPQHRTASSRRGRAGGSGASAGHPRTIRRWIRT